MIKIKSYIDRSIFEISETAYTARLESQTEKILKEIERLKTEDIQYIGLYYNTSFRRFALIIPGDSVADSIYRMDGDRSAIDLKNIETKLNNKADTAALLNFVSKTDLNEILKNFVTVDKTYTNTAIDALLDEKVNKSALQKVEDTSNLLFSSLNRELKAGLAEKANTEDVSKLLDKKAGISYVDTMVKSLTSTLNDKYIKQEDFKTALSGKADYNAIMPKVIEFNDKLVKINDKFDNYYTKDTLKAFADSTYMPKTNLESLGFAKNDDLKEKANKSDLDKFLLKEDAKNFVTGDIVSSFTSTKVDKKDVDSELDKIRVQYLQKELANALYETKEDSSDKIKKAKNDLETQIQNETKERVSQDNKLDTKIEALQDDLAKNVSALTSSISSISTQNTIYTDTKNDSLKKYTDETYAKKSDVFTKDEIIKRYVESDTWEQYTAGNQKEHAEIIGLLNLKADLKTLDELSKNLSEFKAITQEKATNLTNKDKELENKDIFLENKIEAEKERAINAENALGLRVDKENERASKKEDELDTQIKAETARATTAEEKIVQDTKTNLEKTKAEIDNKINDTKKELKENIDTVKNDVLENTKVTELKILEKIENTKNSLNDKMDLVNSTQDQKIETNRLAIENNKTALQNFKDFCSETYVTKTNLIETKTELVANIDKKVEKVIRYKGAVETVLELPVNAKLGDLYNVKENDYNFIYDGEKWDRLSPDLELYVKKVDFDKLTEKHNTLQGEFNVLKEFAEKLANQTAETMNKLENRIIELERKQKPENLDTRVAELEYIKRSELESFVKKEELKPYIRNTEFGTQNTFTQKELDDRLKELEAPRAFNI